MDKKEFTNLLKKAWKKFWFLLWKDNSFKGWAFSIVFLFIFIKFIFFPILTLATGTALPLAIVESCSMYHEGNFFSFFEPWFERHEAKYEQFGIDLEEFSDFPFRRGFSKGDILFMVGANPDKLKVGDIILFNSGSSANPVIHRIVNITEENGEKIFSTIGDNNAQMLTRTNNPAGIDETKITEDQLVGKPLFRITPFLGWAKLIFFEPLRQESERGFCDEN